MTNQDNWAWNRGCDGDPTVAQVRQNMRERFVSWPTGKSDERIVDAVTKVRYSQSGFAAIYATKFAENEEGKKDTACRIWKHDDGKTHIDGLVFRPDREDGLILEGGKILLNTWKPETLPDDLTEEEIEHAADLFNTFLDGIFPVEAEADYVFNWIAHKLQHPAERGVALVIISETKGTGKGALFKLVERLVGDDWSTSMKLADMLGTSAASSYFSEAEHKLLVVIHEAMTAGKDRIAGAENLKTYISPQPERVPLNPKGRDARSAWVFFSTLIGSNNPEQAIPINDTDRRFTVIRTAETPLTQEQSPKAKAAIDELLPIYGEPDAMEQTTRLLQACRAYLVSVKTDRKMFSTILENEAREAAIDGGEGELEVAAKKVLFRLSKTNKSGGMRFEPLVAAVVAEVPGQRVGIDQMVRRFLKQKLSQQAKKQNGETIRGYEGWVHIGRKPVTPPDGAEWEPEPGLTTYVSDRGDQRWQVGHLVVREGFADADPAARGAILDAVLTESNRLSKMVPSNAKKGSKRV